MKRIPSEFFARVYDIVAQIPPGRVMTYGQIAMLVGNPRTARIVGYAMNGAPPERDLPCHRVVSKSGALAPGSIFGGQENQRRLLEQEGVTFTESGLIEMKNHIWWS